MRNPLWPKDYKRNCLSQWLLAQRGFACL